MVKLTWYDSFISHAGKIGRLLDNFVVSYVV